MTAPTRRGLLIAFPGVALLPVLPAIASPAANPDADFIRACDAYRGVMDALNHGNHGEDEDGPIHDAYYACCDTISEGEPHTMAGVLALCRAIKAETRGRNGEPIPLHGTMGADWALTVVDTLLQLNGGAA